MFQMIYLTFTAPRADPAAFGVLTGNLKALLANKEALPDVAFKDALTAALTQDHLRARPLTPELVGQMNLEKSLAFYKDRFADASDFTFVFVGSFDVATMAPLVERYLGSLPALHRHEAARDVGIRPPTGVVEKQIVKGIEPRSQVGVVFTGPFENTEAHRLLVSTMAEMLSGNLHRTLREDLGGTYGVSVEPTFAARPVPEYRVTIGFACDPARLDALIAAAMAVIEEFKRTGPSSGQVADAASARLRELETSLQENVYLLNRILSKYANGEDVAEVFEPRALYDQLTAAAIRDAARQYPEHESLRAGDAPTGDAIARSDPRASHRRRQGIRGRSLRAEWPQLLPPLDERHGRVHRGLGLVAPALRRGRLHVERAPHARLGHVLGRRALPRLLGLQRLGEEHPRGRGVAGRNLWQELLEMRRQRERGRTTRAQIHQIGRQVERPRGLAHAARAGRMRAAPARLSASETAGRHRRVPPQCPPSRG